MLLNIQHAGAIGSRCGDSPSSHAVGSVRFRFSPSVVPPPFVLCSFVCLSHCSLHNSAWGGVGHGSAGHRGEQGGLFPSHSCTAQHSQIALQTSDGTKGRIGGRPQQGHMTSSRLIRLAPCDEHMQHTLRHSSDHQQLHFHVLHQQCDCLTLAQEREHREQHE